MKQTHAMLLAHAHIQFVIRVCEVLSIFILDVLLIHSEEWRSLRSGLCAKFCDLFAQNRTPMFFLDDGFPGLCEKKLRILIVVQNWACIWCRVQGYILYIGVRWWTQDPELRGQLRRSAAACKRFRQHFCWQHWVIGHGHDQGHGHGHGHGHVE